jgi:hypothetical protein
MTSVRRSAFTVHRSPFTVWRSAFTVWRSAFTVWRMWATRSHACGVVGLGSRATGVARLQASFFDFAPPSILSSRLFSARSRSMDLRRRSRGSATLPGDVFHTCNPESRTPNPELRTPKPLTLSDETVCESPSGDSGQRACKSASSKYPRAPTVLE